MKHQHNATTTSGASAIPAHPAHSSASKTAGRGRAIGSGKATHSRSYPRGVGLDFRKLAGLTLNSYIDHHGKHNLTWSKFGMVVGSLEECVLAKLRTVLIIICRVRGNIAIVSGTYKYPKLISSTLLPCYKLAYQHLTTY